MDTKKTLEKLVAEHEAEKRSDTVQINLNIDRKIAQAMRARFPRNKQPSLSQFTEALWADFLARKK